MEITIKMISYEEMKTVYVNTKTNECKLNGKDIKIDTQDFARRVCAITLGWQETKETENTLDNDKYEITIKENGNFQHYAGTNIYPENFFELSQLVDKLG